MRHGWLSRSRASSSAPKGHVRAAGDDGTAAGMAVAAHRVRMDPGASIPAPGDDLSAWRECRDCGLFQRLPPVNDGELAECARCGALLRRVLRGSVSFARLCAVVGAILFILALRLPLIELQTLGRFATSTLFTGPSQLVAHGLPVLAVAVLVTLVAVPATRLAIALAALFGALFPRPPASLAWLFGWLDLLSPWAMIEVFLLGAIVAYTRLEALATVHVGPAIWTLGGVMLATVTIDAMLDRDDLWTRLSRGTDPIRLAGDADRGAVVGCDVCRHVTRAAEGARCPRCRHPLRARGGALARVWALLLTAGLLYIPANVLPVMTVKRLGRGEPSTIVDGVGELAAAHLWPLAIIVLLASIIVPMVKIASLTVLLVLTHRRSGARLRARTRLFRFVHVIGRWSMIDIFMLATLVGVVQLGLLATVLPDLGAAAFCGVVLVTMVATELFDPRIMWDAAAGEEVP
jgi:paraquat-inducible protein A